MVYDEYSDDIKNTYSKMTDNRDRIADDKFYKYFLWYIVKISESGMHIIELFRRICYDICMCLSTYNAKIHRKEEFF